MYCAKFNARHFTEPNGHVAVMLASFAHLQQLYGPRSSCCYLLNTLKEVELDGLPQLSLGVILQCMYLGFRMCISYVARTKDGHFRVDVRSDCI